MFLTDPALRRIAAATNDVLPEHLWLHDTGAPDALGDLARLLHQTTLAFNDNARHLDKALGRASDLAATAQQALARRAESHLDGYRQAHTDVIAAFEWHAILGDTLVTAYRGWREHRPVDSDADRHVLLQPGDPAHGVVLLRRHEPSTWLVFPDTEAAAAFDVPYLCRIVGEVAVTDHGWRPTAYTDAQHRRTKPDMRYPLPDCDDLAAACRSLLRWWHLRHSAAWRNRTSAELTAAELADLAA